MKYMGKLILKKPCPMVAVAREFIMEDIKTFETGDIVGTMKWRGGVILVMLHLSSGDMVYTESVKVYAHHVEETEYSEFWKLIAARFEELIGNKVENRKRLIQGDVLKCIQ